MKCQIQWITPEGKPTPDDNEAVAIAHSHDAIWQYPSPPGHPENRIVGYSESFEHSFPICADHLSQVTPSIRRSWSFTPLLKNGSELRLVYQAINLLAAVLGSQTETNPGTRAEDITRLNELALRFK